MNLLKDKSFNFAIRIVKLYKYLNEEKKELILSKQMLRSGTSIGAMVSESEHSESKSDFIHKLSIAQKEANETLYWLKLLYMTDYISQNVYESINEDASELMRIITASIKTAKQSINHLSLTINH